VDTHTPILIKEAWDCPRGLQKKKTQKNPNNTTNPQPKKQYSGQAPPKKLCYYT